MKPEKPPSGSSKGQAQKQSKRYIAPLFEDQQLVQAAGAVSLQDQTTALEEFREQWRQEIAKPKSEEVSDEQRREREARELFLEGVECEKRGEMSEAVHKYTRAMKLVPDIERKVHVPAPRARSTSRTRSSTVTAKRGGKGQEEAAAQEDDLVHTFQSRVAERGVLFTPEGSTCLLNRLPTEILSMVVRYAVGADINVRILENLSEVSSGMYLLARDNELWRQIHLRSLGCSQAPLQEADISWRDVYLSYPHLHFEGVYLSKITYIRHGETGFQDSNYRPWHTVVYFRLLRFFPDGSALMTTSSDSPQTAVNLLKARVPGKTDTAVCVGTWYQEDNDVILQLRREYPPPTKPKYTRQTKRSPGQEYGILKHSFRIVLRLFPMKVQGKWSLQWVKNHCTVTYLDGTMTTSDLEADKNLQEFPPLRFYRVKSYTEATSSKF